MYTKVDTFEVYNIVSFFFNHAIAPFGFLIIIQQYFNQYGIAISCLKALFRG